MARPRLYLPLIVIILLGFGLRILDLQGVPLRGDEAFSAQYWADTPLNLALTEIAPQDPHPPLAFILFRLWRHVIGGTSSVFALRFLPVLGNTIGIAASFALGRRLSRERAVGLLAALMWALHPFEIWHSQDFRNYAIWAGLSATAMWLGLRLIEEGRRADWRAYALLATAAGLIFYAELTVMLSLLLAAIWRRRLNARSLRRLAALQGAILAVVLICFGVLQAGPIISGSYAGNLQPFAPLDYVTRFIPALLIGETAKFPQPAAGILLSLLLAFAAISLHRKCAPQFRFLAFWIALPLLLLGGVSLFRDVFHPRYVLATAPAFILMFVLGACQAAGWLGSRLGVNRNILAGLLLAPWFALAAIALQDYYAGFNDPGRRKAPAWDELGGYLDARVEADDLVIQLSADAAFGYYYAGLAPDIALPINSEQAPAAIYSTLGSVSERYKSVFVVSNTNPSWRNRGLVESWMRENMQEVMRTDASGLPVRQYKHWRVEEDFAGEVTRFEDTVALVGVDSRNGPLPTGELLLWLYWKPLSSDERGLKSFVHIYGPPHPDTASLLWTQHDQYPQAGRTSTVDWQPGSILRDVYYLPLQELDPGEYRIEAGWYDPSTGARLSSAEGNDTVAIKHFRISDSGVAYGE